MTLLIVVEYRFRQTPDRTVWSRSLFTHLFWQRYLDVFDEVKVVARVNPVPQLGDQFARADGPRVSFVPLPYYVGTLGYLKRAWRVRRATIAAFERGDAVLFRVFSPLSAPLYRYLRRSGYPFGLEVVGDPTEVFSRGAMRHPLRPLLRVWFGRQLRRQCFDACAAAYVTESNLQRRYPVRPGAYATHYSSVALSDDAFVASPRRFSADSPGKLVFVGSMAQMYKAPDVLLDAVALCHRQGMELSLVMVGDGKHRAALARRAAGLGLVEQVRFTGELPSGAAVRTELDNADLFVLPSRTEGLPRAMIEAMARGLPCVGSAVGGIPELLPVDDLVPAGDCLALAGKIREVLVDPQRLHRMSVRNLQKARAYRDTVLSARRTEFYRHLKHCTQDWLRSASAG